MNTGEIIQINKLNTFCLLSSSFPVMSLHPLTSFTLLSVFHAHNHFIFLTLLHPFLDSPLHLYFALLLYHQERSVAAVD